MCGLIAFVGEGANRHADGLRRGLAHLGARGPDAEGKWSDERAWLGHRRLAILDLDHRSDQPMQSLCERFVIAFNGEIYNYQALRKELLSQGVPMRTEGDTEVILELFARQGAEMLSKLRGMFAFVIWDRLKGRAFAARDPYGIKPLYVARTPNGVMLASQVRSIMATGLVSKEPCPAGQAGFWLLGSVPEPYTWFRDIQPVRSGHYGWVTPLAVNEQRCWWDIAEAWKRAPERSSKSNAEVLERVQVAIRESVAYHVVADVPVGVFLSGGIDSGAVAALTQDAGVGDIQGVTISYQEYAGSSDDEVPAAAATARHFGIQHHVRTVTRDEFSADFGRIVDCMDQPSIDGVNTWYASKAVAERGLKVVLSGIGGDELFQGYESFQQLPRLTATWGAISRVPGAQWLGEKLFNRVAERSEKNRWRHLPDWLQSIAGAWWLRRSLFAPEDLPDLMGEELLNEGLRNFSPELWITATSASLNKNPRVALGQIEATQYLRNQLLRDSDWASMDHSVELRTPLVDAWLLRDVAPFLCAFERFPGKSLLATAPSRSLPDLVMTRRKTGFTIPVRSWVSDEKSHRHAVSTLAWARKIREDYEKSMA